jgi:hypothetical protein
MVARNILPVAVLALAASMVACGPRGTPQVANGVTLLRFGQLNGYPAGLFHGRVSFANGCASVESAPGVTGTGLWSSGTRLDNSTGVLRIVIDGVPFTEGDAISMGGGEYADEDFLVSLVGPIPPTFQGERYYLLPELVAT